MRKADIKPGVTYAYQELSHQPVRPVVLLAASPYEMRRKGESGPMFRPAREGARVGQSYRHGPACGYPAVRPTSTWRRQGRDWAAITQRMARFTLPDFTAAAEGRIDDDIEFGVIDRLSCVLGPWDEVIAATKAADEAKREMAQRQEAETSAARARAIDIIMALAAHGIAAHWIPAHGSVDSISLSLDEAERVVELLKTSTGGGQSSA